MRQFRWERLDFVFSRRVYFCRVFCVNNDELGFSGFIGARGWDEGHETLSPVDPRHN
jgi:hypothetical protein